MIAVAWGCGALSTGCDGIAVGKKSYAQAMKWACDRDWRGVAGAWLMASRTKGRLRGLWT